MAGEYLKEPKKRGINRGPSHLSRSPGAGGVQGAESNGGGLDRYYEMNPHAKPGEAYSKDKADAQTKHRNKLRKEDRAQHVAQIQGTHSEEAQLAQRTGMAMTPGGQKEKEIAKVKQDTQHLPDTKGSAMTGSGGGALGAGLLDPPERVQGTTAYAAAAGGKKGRRTIADDQGLDPSLGDFNLGKPVGNRNLFKNPYET